MARFDHDTYRSLNESIAKVQNPQAALNEALEYTAALEAALLALCEELGLDPEALMEDVFDSPTSAAASRANVKRVKKALGARSPHTKAVTKLHGAMKKSRYYYGISDSELDRRAGDEYDDFGRPFKKPKLTPMSGKSFDGYDASFGGKKKGVNLGVVKKASSAIKKTELARKKAKKPVK